MRALKFILLFLLVGFLLLVASFFHHANAQQPAFPGAEGCGRFTSGGRGTAAQPTTVFEITSLADDNSVGTLRNAINASSATYPYRTIVFRVSGTIHLLSKLDIKANTTIAGQTAPGDGICLADYPVVLSGDNIIVRYIRARLGDKNELKTTPAGCGVPVAPFTSACMPLNGSGGDDALGGLGNKNIIIDHCTASWSNDESLTVYRGDSITLQWNLIEEPLNYSYHFETGDADFEHHGYGGIWGSKHGSFHHNLFANCKSRCPRWAGNNTYAAGEVENCDFRNNVMYNWELYTVYGGEGGNYNLVNNYYKNGPNTGSVTKYRVANVDSNATFGYAQYYMSGNYIDGSPENTANNWSGAYMMSGNAADTVKSKHTVPFLSTYPQITTQSPADAYEAVLNNAGAILPRRDTLDRRVINNVRYRTGMLIDVQGNFPHATPYAQTVNAWPALASAPAPTDTDHDGMPDAWENANGSDPNDASDRQTVAANGYTYLENYLNNITNTSPEVNFSGSLSAFSQVGTPPSAVQTVTVTGVNLTGNVTLTAPVGFQLSTNGGSTWFGNSSPIVLTASGGNLPATTLSIRLNGDTAGNYSNYITAVTAGVGTFYLRVIGSKTAVAAGNAPAVATWTLLSNPDPTVSGAITATSQTLGSAISGTQYGTTFGGVSGWQRAGSTTYLPVNFNANSYVEYTITPGGGKSFTDTAITVSALGGGTGTARMAIYYSTDGFATSYPVGAITYNGTTYSNSTDNTNSVALLNTSTASLTGQQIATVSVVPNITAAPGQTLAIRVYAWITGSGNRYLASQNMIVKGYTSDPSLPLKLTDFSAALQNKQVQLQWTTVNEINTAKFEVESSADGNRFAGIGTVAASSRASQNNYRFTDPQLLTSVRYYRLKIYDKDGSFYYSKMAVVNPAGEGLFSVFPNPAVNLITVTYPKTVLSGKIQLVSSDGRTLQTIILPAGSTQTSVDVKSLSTGSYYLKLDGYNHVQSFIKQ